MSDHLTGYEEARAKAQAAADADGFDRGLAFSPIFKEWTVWMLPGKPYRCGHELRCEVVMCSTLAKCQKGHGPQ